MDAFAHAHAYAHTHTHAPTGTPMKPHMSKPSDTPSRLWCTDSRASFTSCSRLSMLAWVLAIWDAGWGGVGWGGAGPRVQGGKQRTLGDGPVQDLPKPRPSGPSPCPLPS